jgi:Protein phosphatase 2C
VSAPVERQSNGGRQAAEGSALTSFPGAPTTIGDGGRAATAVVPKPDDRFPFRHDIATDTARIPGHAGDLHVLGASVRGLSHFYYGKVRQDSFAYLVTEDHRWLVAAVADGVSSGDHSHLAADIVAEWGCQLIARHLAEHDAADLDWRRILTGVATRIVDDACERFGFVEPSLADVAGRMAATALYAVVALEPAETGERPVHVMALGDTSAWLLCPAEQAAWVPLQQIKNSANVVASSATEALPGLPGQLAPAIRTSLRQDEVLVLMSDGGGDPIGDGTGEVGLYLADAWKRPPDPFTFTSQVGFRRRSYDDDRTVLAVWPVT